MKITYTPNPLNTIIELDDQEIEILRLKIKIDELQDRMFQGHFYLTNPQFKDEDKAKTILDPDYYLDDHCALDARVDTLLQHYLEELKSSHHGDCTCFPATCSKCLAENLLGLNTTKGLGKSGGYQIWTAFNFEVDGQWRERTLDEALGILQTKERQDGYEFLNKYKEVLTGRGEGNTGIRRRIVSSGAKSTDE